MSISLSLFTFLSLETTSESEREDRALAALPPPKKQTQAKQNIASLTRQVESLGEQLDTMRRETVGEFDSLRTRDVLRWRGKGNSFIESRSNEGFEKFTSRLPVAVWARLD